MQFQKNVIPLSQNTIPNVLQTSLIRAHRQLQFTYAIFFLNLFNRVLEKLFRLKIFRFISIRPA